MPELKPFIARIVAGETLTAAEAADAFGAMLDGAATPAQLAAFLTALRMRGEGVAEIEGAARAMRARMTRVNAPADAIDIVGTGGDNSGSYNVSTLAAILVAACGVPVAKHGNRAASSASGAADVLGALGVKVGLSPAGVEACIREAGIGFMMAPAHHPAMKHVAPVRGEIGFRTVFNLLGPLSNPAGVRRMLLGVAAPHLMRPMAEALLALGIERAMVVHGSDGLDEATTTGPTEALLIEGGSIASMRFGPEDAGLPRAAPESLKGGDPAHNAAALRAVLDGAPGPYRDIAILNAGAALFVAGAADLAAGAARAAAAIDDGRAREGLARLVAASQAAA
jgi:anthranilate phosphoribosyltransferase